MLTASPGVSLYRTHFMEDEDKLCNLSECAAEGRRVGLLDLPGRCRLRSEMAPPSTRLVFSVVC